MLDSKSQIIVNMYQGEMNRDASSKVRGFLFQDLIAVDELLKSQTNYVCMEYLEDVFTVSENALHIIQAKYYPKSKVIMREVIRELYYQFLRLQLYGYSGIVSLSLVTHTGNVPQKPTLAIMQGEEYINVKCSVQPSTPDDVDTWFKTNVYPLTKEARENTCFQNYAWDGSIEKFLDSMIIISDIGTLNTFRVAIADKLDALDFSGCPILDTAMRRNVLLGLSVQYIQETYNEKLGGIDVFNFRKLDRKLFLKYISDHICTESEEVIGAYLRSVVMDSWDSVEKNNTKLSQEQADMLQFIRDNTANWLYCLGCTSQGQLQLLNTVSMRDEKIFMRFLSKTITARRQMINEHHDSIEIFLRYLWKIMLNINYELLGKELTNEEQDKLKPETYLDVTEIRYLKMTFPGETARSSIILSSPNSSKIKEEITCAFERMAVFRPQKWYMHSQTSGMFSYDQKITDITNNKSISILHPDQFRIECMNCVKVDCDCWHQTEDCRNTIFLDTCIKLTEDGK